MTVFVDDRLRDKPRNDEKNRPKNNVYLQLYDILSDLEKKSFLYIRYSMAGLDELTSICLYADPIVRKKLSNLPLLGKKSKRDIVISDMLNTQLSYNLYYRL